MTSERKTDFHTRLAVVVPNIPINSTRMALITGGIRFAESQGYHMTLTFLRAESGDIEDVLMISKLAEAVLPFVHLPDDIMQRLEEENIKVLEPIISPGNNFFNMYAVMTGTAGRMAVERMVQRGRKHLAYVCDSYEPVQILHQLRYAGMVKVSVEKGIKSPQMFAIKAGDPNIAGKLVDFLREHDDINGLVCHNDLIAIEVMQALRQLGRSVPSDIAVIGADDAPECSLVNPTLTSVGYNLETCINWGGRALVATLNGEEFEPPTVEDMDDVIYIAARQSI